MIIKTLGFSGIFFFFIVAVNCGGATQSFFKVKDCWYQSWVINDNEKGTDIFIELNQVEKGVTFDSIIFRNAQLPVYITYDNGKVLLRSILNVGTSRIISQKEFADKPDQLLYTFNGKKYSYLLKNIRRAPMKYLKK